MQNKGRLLDKLTVQDQVFKFMMIGWCAVSTNGKKSPFCLFCIFAFVFLPNKRVLMGSVLAANARMVCSGSHLGQNEHLT